jgi:chemotaxis response regulator CheB
MPKEAVKCGAVEKSMPLDEISREIAFERRVAGIS